MSGRVSPFAALTGAERQLKWMEYQSIRLPYVQGNVGEPLDEEQQNLAIPMEKQSVPKQMAPQTEQALLNPQKSSTAQTSAVSPSVDYQKTRHRQYDAIIARMKQAELRTNSFHPFA